MRRRIIFSLLFGLSLVSAAHAEVAKSADGVADMLGVNVHLSYTHTVYVQQWGTLVKPRLKELGVRHVRDGLGDFRNKTFVARLLELGSIGVDVTLVVDPRSAPDFGKVPAYAEMVLPVIKGFEGPNEWDLDPGLQYKGMSWPRAQALYEADLWNTLKGVPALARFPVALGAMAYDSGSRLKICAIASCPSPNANNGSMHPYPGTGYPSAGLDRTLENASKGHSSVVATETGYHTDNSPGGVTEIAEAKYYSRTLFEYSLRGIAGVYLYELMDEADNRREAERHFGLVRADGSVKPAFDVLRREVALLSDGPGKITAELGLTITGGDKDLHHELLAKRDGRFYLAIWQERWNYNSATNTDSVVHDMKVHVAFGKSFGSARIYDPLVSDVPLATLYKVGAVDLSVPDHALVVELRP